MKKIVLCFAVYCFYQPYANAQNDIISEDLLLGNAVSSSVVQEEKNDNKETAKENTKEQMKVDSSENGEKNGIGHKILSFIKKPLDLFYSADDEVKSDDGTKETFLDRSIRQANEGSIEDQMNLGYMYLYGTNGVEQDFAKALEYYTMAAEQNDPNALNNLGSLYFNGIGTTADPKKALSLFNKSAELGNEYAAVNLAFIYLTGGTKNELRNRKAVALFQKAADSGNKIAKFMLGYAYYTGFVVPQNYDKAFKLIQIAASDDSLIDEAQYVMGEMYINGYGTVQNYQKAIQYLRYAVGQGNQDAYMALAKIYHEGKIDNANLVRAHALYNIAAANNIANAAEKRDKIGKQLKMEELTEAQNEAQNFKAEPSELTNYIRQTYGNNIRDYINNNIYFTKNIVK